MDEIKKKKKIFEENLSVDDEVENLKIEVRKIW